jgi:S-adenosylmethionine uptake transporter
MDAPPAGGRPASHAAAFAAAALAVAAFSGMDAVMKELVLALGTYTALFWRNVAAAAIAGGLYAARRRPPIRAGAWRVHAVRAAVTTAMMLCFFWGLARVPMAQAVALTFVAPLLALVLAAALLGERVGGAAVGASAAAFAGVAVIVAAQWRLDAGAEALRGSAAILVSALLYAWNIVLMRRQALVADPVEIAFTQSTLVAALLTLGAPWLAEWPALHHAPLLVLAAVLSIAALLLFGWAYARSDAHRLAASEYTAFVWAALLGWLVFGERLDARTAAGAALIVGGCLVAARRQGRAPAAEAAALEGRA